MHGHMNDSVDNINKPIWRLSVASRYEEAPIKLECDLSFEQRIFLLKHDKDSFVKWDNAQKLWLSLIMDADTIDEVAFYSCCCKFISLLSV
jgi:aminopeptidase N